MIFATGSNYFGQLGIGIRRRENAYLPTPFGSTEELNLDTEFVDDVQCGSQFSVVQYKNGSLGFCGTMNGNVYQSLIPIEIPLPVKCRQVACGRKHIVALMEKGIVVSWGVGYFGQLGHGDDSSWDAPRLVGALEPKRLGCKVTSVSCGGCHSAAVLENGKVFCWGLNKSGQCGVPNGTKVEYVLEPKVVDCTEIGTLKIGSVVCGRTHTAFVATVGRVFVCGESSHGRLGLVDAKKFQVSPTEIITFRSIPVQSVACGDLHMMALTADGVVYSWGYGADGQTGHSTLLSVRTPRRIEYFVSHKIIQIGCGPTWSVAVSQSGNLFCWGYNDLGWLGIRPPSQMPHMEGDRMSAAEASNITDHIHIRSFDSVHNVLRPQKVKFLSEWHVNRVRIGTGHMLLMCSSKVMPGASNGNNNATSTNSTAMSVGSDNSVMSTSGGFLSKLGNSISIKSDSKSGSTFPMLKLHSRSRDEVEDMAKMSAVPVDQMGRRGSFGLPSTTSKFVGANINPNLNGGGKATGASANSDALAVQGKPSAIVVNSKFDSKPSVRSPKVQQTSGGTSLPAATNGVPANSNTIQLINWSRHKKVAELTNALSAGENPNVQDSAGNTPMIVACQNGHQSVCQLLLKFGADANLANFRGNTPLHYCFNYGYDELGKFLIESGSASDYLTNKEGLTCYEGLTHSDLDLL